MIEYLKGLWKKGEKDMSHEFGCEGGHDPEVEPCFYGDDITDDMLDELAAELEEGDSDRVSRPKPTAIQRAINEMLETKHSDMTGVWLMTHRMLDDEEELNEDLKKEYRSNPTNEIRVLLIESGDRMSALKNACREEFGRVRALHDLRWNEETNAEDAAYPSYVEEYRAGLRAIHSQMHKARYQLESELEQFYQRLRASDFVGNEVADTEAAKGAWYLYFAMAELTEFAAILQRGVRRLYQIDPEAHIRFTLDEFETVWSVGKESVSVPRWLAGTLGERA